MIRKYVLAFLIFLISLSTFSQKVYSPMYRYDFINKQSQFFYPFLMDNDSIEGSNKSYVYRKVFEEPFISIHKDGLYVTINPLMNFSMGKSDLKDDYLLTNVRGIGVMGSIGDHLLFNTSFYETQLYSPQWIDDYYQYTGVLPGRTNPKPFKDSGYDYGAVYGSLKYHHQYKDLNYAFQIGYDEFFIGEGYRSMFLSDHGMPFYHGLFQLGYKKWSYNHITGSLQNPNYHNFLGLDTVANVKPHEKKTLSIHYLNWKPFHALSIGFFESTIFETSKDGSNQFSLAYVNPIPLVNAFAFNLDGKHNVMLGLDLNYEFLDNLSVYTQFLADKFDGDNVAYQISSKYISENIKCRIEYNMVGKETYSFHDMRQSYTHYNGYLAHPTGNGFKEWVFQLGYKINRWEIEGKTNFISNLEDAEIDEKKSYFSGTLLYVFNPHTRLQVFANTIYLKQDMLDNELYFNVGIRTQLRNTYWDF